MTEVAVARIQRAIAFLDDAAASESPALAVGWIDAAIVAARGALEELRADVQRDLARSQAQAQVRLR